MSHYDKDGDYINPVKVARLVDECGSAVILKNNVPRYLVIDFSKADSYASHSIDSADWWKRWSQRLQFIGLCIRKYFSVFWRG